MRRGRAICFYTIPSGMGHDRYADHEHHLLSNQLRSLSFHMIVTVSLHEYRERLRCQQDLKPVFREVGRLAHLHSRNENETVAVP